MSDVPEFPVRVFAAAILQAALPFVPVPPVGGGS
jgi:hypothetical protein